MIDYLVFLYDSKMVMCAIRVAEEKIAWSKEMYKAQYNFDTKES